jgi:hypothetical protein
VRLNVAVNPLRIDPILEHWSQLCVEAKTEAVKLKQSYEHMITWLVLRATDPPSEPSPDDVAKAVEICVKRCQELEQKVIDLEDSQLGPTPAPSNIGLVVPPGHVAIVRDRDGSLREVKGPKPLTVDPHEIYKAILGSIEAVLRVHSASPDEMARNAAQAVMSLLEAQLDG